MKLSTWRPGLTSWLTSNLVVDSLELKVPLAPGLTTGFISPLRDVSYINSGGQLYGNGTQQIFWLTRYPSTLKYYQLPLALLEGIHSSISIQLYNYLGTQELTEYELLTIKEPCKVIETGDGLGEWLVELNWSYQLSWLAEVELTYSTEVPIELRLANIGIYRGSLDGNSKVLDNQLAIDPERLTDGTSVLTDDKQLTRG